MKYARKRTLLLLSVIVLSVSSGVLGQDKPATGEKGSDDLVHSANFTKQKFEELLSAMSDVARMMEKTDPEVARILRQTVDHAQREDVADKMEDVIRSLRKGLDEAAESHQSSVIDDLTQMLRILEGGVKDQSTTDAKLAELRAIRARIEKILKRQEAEEKITRPAAHTRDIDGETQRILKALRDIIAKQEELISRTAKIRKTNPSVRRLAKLRSIIRSALNAQKKLNAAAKDADLAQLPVLAEAQDKLIAGAEKVIKQIGKATADVDLKSALRAAGTEPKVLQIAGDKVRSAAKEMKRASGSLGKSAKADARVPQQQAAVDLENAARTINDAIDKMLADTPSGGIAKEQSDLAGRTRKLAGAVAAAAEKAGIDPTTLKGNKGDLKKATGCMELASEKLTAQEPQGGRAEQDKALAELKGQLARAAELRRRATAEAGKKLDPTEQEQIASDTGKVAEKMKKGSDGKPTPAQPSVSKAGQCASGACGKMSNNDASGANRDQNEAIDNLKEALEKLDEEIARLDRRSKAEKLAAIEERLGKILEEQKLCTKQTRKTYEARSDKAPIYDREAQQTLAELSRIEGLLGEEVQSVRRVLLKEGTTVVFPEILGDVKEDLADVQKQLAGMDGGVLTQAKQEEIEQTLQELIDAVRKELSKGHGRAKAGGGGGGGCKPPLIPPVAELRMLRAKQIRINRRTQRLNGMISGGKLTGREAVAEVRKLSVRQQRAAEIARRISDKMKTDRPNRR